jgi:ethanolamine ammonia-lyase large subunit
MKLKTTIQGETFEFKSIKDVLAKSAEARSGDDLIGVSAKTERERIAAKWVVANLTLQDLYENPVLPYEEDEVTRVIIDDTNKAIYNRLKGWTVADLRAFLLDQNTTNDDIQRMRKGLTSEMISAVVRLMSVMDMLVASKKIYNPKRANTTIGLPGTLSYRNQPNHPTDDIDGIMAQVYEGLTYGSGDIVLGINPVDPTPDTLVRILTATYDAMQRWEIPTQNSALGHITDQMEAARRGAPIGLFFQSLAGNEAANKGFGIDLKMMEEAWAMARELSYCGGDNVMYFETGQGSEMSVGLDFGADEQTLESRTYGYGRHFNPFCVNNVTGFIGPETHLNGQQVAFGTLEDLFCGKMHGFCMGLAPCYVNHVDMNHNDQEMATVLGTAGGAVYYMGMSMGDDCMLSYQDTSYHDDPSLREIFGLRPAPEFEKWLERMGIMCHGKLTKRAGDPSIFSANPKDIFLW